MLPELQGAAWRDSADTLLLTARFNCGSNIKPAGKNGLILKQYSTVRGGTG